MNSTKDREQDGRLRAAAFFNDVLVPLARRERAAGREFFALRPDAAAESYYVEPTRRTMTPDDFELRAAESVADFIRELAALWVAEGRGELVAMAARLGELASVLGAEEQQEEDVSPFIYVMF